MAASRSLHRMVRRAHGHQGWCAQRDAMAKNHGTVQRPTNRYTDEMSQELRRQAKTVSHATRKGAMRSATLPPRENNAHADNIVARDNGQNTELTITWSTIAVTMKPRGLKEPGSCRVLDCI
jgi:hypothetical protein